jgi:hypothetical protein
MSPADVRDSNVGSGGVTDSEGGDNSVAGGGSGRTNRGGSSGGGMSSGLTASISEKAKEKIHELTGDVELPAATSYTVIAAVMIAVPLLFWMDPDYRWLRKEAHEQEKRIQHKYHSID